MAHRNVWKLALGKVLCLFVFVVAGRAQAVDQAALDRIMAEALKSWNVPGAAIVVVRGEEVVYVKGFGVRSVSGGEPVTPETLFAIGSTSKAFTTAAMAVLADEGKMAWDDPVRKHLHGFRLADPLANDNVTLRDIVTHRTGLVRHDLLWYGSPWSRDEIIHRIGFVPLTYPMRTNFQYQNIMFLAAGQAVAHASGSSWEEFVKARLFEPLGMKTANFSVNDVIKVADRATPHQRVGDKNVQIPWRNIDNVAPAGSINAGVGELANWLKLHLNDGRVGGKQIISAANIGEMHMPQMVVRIEGRWKLFFGEPETTQLSYGLGWFISSYRGHKLVGHGGSIDGFRAQIQLVPAAKLGVAVVANLGNTQLPEAVAYQVLDKMLGLEPRDWNRRLSEESKRLEAEGAAAVKARFEKRVPDTRPSHPLSDYVGEYGDPGYGTSTIAVDGDALVLRWSFARLKLEHFHYDTFTPGRTGAMAGELIQFHLDPEGRVEGMTFQGVRFKRSRS